MPVLHRAAIASPSSVTINRPAVPAIWPLCSANCRLKNLSPGLSSSPCTWAIAPSLAAKKTRVLISRCGVKRNSTLQRLSAAIQLSDSGVASWLAGNNAWAFCTSCARLTCRKRFRYSPRRFRNSQSRAQARVKNCPVIQWIWPRQIPTTEVLCRRPKLPVRTPWPRTQPSTNSTLAWPI